MIGSIILVEEPCHNKRRQLLYEQVIQDPSRSIFLVKLTKL
jgi:hypothetical protein